MHSNYGQKCCEATGTIQRAIFGWVCPTLERDKAGWCRLSLPDNTTSPFVYRQQSRSALSFQHPECQLLFTRCARLQLVHLGPTQATQYRLSFAIFSPTKGDMPTSSARHPSLPLHPQLSRRKRISGRVCGSSRLPASHFYQHRVLPPAHLPNSAVLPFHFSRERTKIPHRGDGDTVCGTCHALLHSARGASGCPWGVLSGDYMRGARLATFLRDPGSKTLF